MTAGSDRITCADCVSAGEGDSHGVTIGAEYRNDGIVQAVKHGPSSQMAKWLADRNSAPLEEESEMERARR